MKFKKGDKRPEKAGIKKGQKQAKTMQWEAIGEALVTTHAERFNQILASSDDDKFAKLFLEVMEYFKPKQSRVETKQEGDQQINIKIVRT